MVKIGIIFDSRVKIGGGHFWRCLNLAKILNTNNRDFFFISNFLNKQFIKILKKENFKYIQIKSLNNFSKIKKIIENFKLQIMITDFYDLEKKNKKKIKQIVKSLIVIDDHIDRKHHSDIYINPNFMTKKSIKMIKKYNPNSILLLGIKYFISSNKFSKIKKKIENKKLKNIFVFFGSSDPTNETLKFIRSIKNFKKINFKILVGKINKNYEKIKMICRNNKNIKIFYNLSNYETLKLMKNNDLSFGAGGINLTERLFSYLPSVVICTARNQKRALIELNKKKIIHFLGDHKYVNINMIKNCVKEFANEPKKISYLLKKTYENYVKKINTSSLKKELNKYIKKKF